MAPPRRCSAARVLPSRHHGELEHPQPGEVVWRDDLGVTCRRWNWRQCVRTRLTTQTTRAVFILDALGLLSESELDAATAALVDALRDTSPDADVTTRLLTR